MLGAMIGLHQLKSTGNVTIDTTFSRLTKIASKKELLALNAWKS